MGIGDARKLERHGDVLERGHGGDEMERLEDDADIAAAEARGFVHAGNPSLADAMVPGARSASLIWELAGAGPDIRPGRVAWRLPSRQHEANRCLRSRAAAEDCGAG